MFNFLLSVFISAASFAVLAFICSLVVVTGFSSPGNNYKLVFSATVAAFLLALVFWTGSRLFFKKVSVRLGAILGSFVGAISHPLMWFIYFTLTSAGSSAPPDEPDIEAWWATVIFSFLSLAGYGWLTISLGTALGALISKSTLRIFSRKTNNSIN